MIKKIKVPLQLEPFSNEFKDLFTKPSYGSFRDLCGALSVCDKSKTVANLCDTMAECRKGIRRLKSPGERPHAVIKRVFGAGRVLVTIAGGFKFILK